MAKLQTLVKGSGKTTGGGKGSGDSFTASIVIGKDKDDDNWVEEEEEVIIKMF